MRIGSHGAEPLENSVGARPESQLRIHGGGEICQGREASVMEAKAPQELPDPFDGIELRTVWRQEMETKARSVEVSPLSMQGRVVVLRIVGDDDHTPACRRADSAEMAKEVPAGLGIEVAKGLRAAQFSVADSNRPKVADGLSGRGMVADGIGHLGRHPHPATAAVLLEVHLIQRPQIDGGVSGQSAEFFCVRPVAADLPKQPEVAASAAGIPFVGTAAGIAGREGLCRGACSGTRTGADHPRGERPGRSRMGCHEALSRRGRDRHRSIERAGPFAPRRSSLQSRPARIDAPSSRPPGENRPARSRLDGNSTLAPPAGPHGADGRNRLPSCAESRPEARRPSLRGCQCSTPSWNAIIGQPDAIRNNL